MSRASRRAAAASQVRGYGAWFVIYSAAISKVASEAGSLAERTPRPFGLAQRSHAKDRLHLPDFSRQLGILSDLSCFCDLQRAWKEHLHYGPDQT